MMGPRPEAQAALFYETSLENHVPQGHLLRPIDRLVDLRSIRTHLAEFHRHTGRPSVDPELLIRMLLVGYCLGKSVAKYQSLKHICQACLSKMKCCPKADARQIARDIARTRHYDLSVKFRKKRGMLFAQLKRNLGPGRLRLRGPCGAVDAFLLSATAQNLRKPAKIFPAPRQMRKA